MRRIKILVIDDDESLRRVLEYNLAQEGYAVLTASSGEQGLELLKKEGADLVLTDVRMAGMDGLQVLERARKLDPAIQVIILTAFGTIEMAVEAMKAGAFHYISKPFNRDELKLTIKKALQVKDLERENVALRQELSSRVGLDSIIAESPQMAQVLDMVVRVAPTETTVLIMGESGTGKELIARAVHSNSPRARGPFVAVNCAAIPENLLESELFGHVRGAFTGAIRDRVGKFEAADGGTVFLDEIGEMRPDLQVKILRVLEERTLERVGDNRPIRVDVRVLAATNKDLGKAIQAGEFREDLYYRLNVVPVAIPPLRARRDDIRVLAQHFLRHLGAAPSVTIAPEAFRALESYEWPGNVRELENALERALIFHRGDVIGLADLPETIRVPPVREAAALPVSLPESGLSLEEVEKELILRALQKHDWNQSRAARYLGITRHTLLYRMEKHNIVRPGGKAAPAEEEKLERPEEPR
jgi:DNA-binding NtrC family response regulator